MSNAELAFVGTIIGAVISILTTFLTERGTQRRERRKNTEERVQIAREHQMETLRNLQTSVAAYVAACHKTYFERVASIQSGVAWPPQQHLSDAVELMATAETPVHVFSARTMFWHLREKTDELVRVGYSVVAPDDDEAREANRQLGELEAVLNGDLGQNLRSLEFPEDLLLRN